MDGPRMILWEGRHAWQNAWGTRSFGRTQWFHDNHNRRESHAENGPPVTNSRPGAALPFF